MRENERMRRRRDKKQQRARRDTTTGRRGYRMWRVMVDVKVTEEVDSDAGELNVHAV